MEILQVCPYFFPHAGGVESHVLELSRELQRRGHRVTVLTSNHGDHPAREEVFDIPVVRVKPLMIWLTSPITPGLRRAVMELGAAVVHVHSPPPLSSYYAARACKISRKPLVVTYHCDLELPRGWGPVVTGIYRRTLGAASLKRAARVIVTSRTYAATSRTLWGISPTIIPMAVDARWFQPKASGKESWEHLRKEEKILILYVGRLVRHKGIEYLLEAATRVPEALFLVAGEGPHRGPLEAYGRALGAANVLFLGRIPEADLPGLYATADLLVLPSTSRLEAFGTVALEAMACGRPVVLSDIPGVREVITDGREGLLFEPMNSEDLASKVRRLARDPDLRQAMGLRGRRRVEDTFNMERIARQVEAVYTDVLNPGTSGSSQGV